MSKLIDLTGQKFERLTVVEYVGTYKGRCAQWLCKCDCGNTKITTGRNLRKGLVKSCGCLNDEERHRPKVERRKYGDVRTEDNRLYSIWQSMKRRCYSKTDPHYKMWGARGIKICDEWINDFKSFEKWAMENGYSDNLSIDRIDNDGNYEPYNCRWSTNKEQSNNRRSNVLVTYKGETRTMTEWCELKNLNYDMFRERIVVLGWSAEKAIETPSQRKGGGQ